MRARHECQIRALDTNLGHKFEDAITLLAFHRGLAWFTDEQIADIRSEIIRSEWVRHQFTRRRRKNRAILAKTTKEQADV